MARSVSVPGDAVKVAYASFECSDDGYDCSEEFSDCIESLRAVLGEKYPSLEEVSRWVGNELRVVLKGPMGAVGVSEYCGLVAVWAVPNPGAPLGAAWCGRLDLDAAAACFGPTLRKVGTASNGEAFFKPADGVERGSLGLGFTSKEGWL